MISIIQNIYQSFGKGDIQGILFHLSDDVLWMDPNPSYIPAGGTRHGKEGVRDFFLEIMASKDVMEFKIDSIIQGDSNTVMVKGHETMRFKSTEKIYQTEFVMLWLFNEKKKVIKYQSFVDTRAIADAFL